MPRSGVQDDGDMPESVFSSGVQLTEQQWDRRNAIMLAFGAGVGASFVQCLSRKDIEHRYLISFSYMPNYPAFYLLSCFVFQLVIFSF